MRHTAGYSLLGHRNSENSLEDIRIGPAEKKMVQHEQIFLNHVVRMEDNSLTLDLSTC
jgi:hypothetical protein